MRYTVKSDFRKENQAVNVQDANVEVDGLGEFSFRLDERNPGVIYARRNGTEVPLLVSMENPTSMVLSLRGYSYGVEVFTERDRYFQSLHKKTRSSASGAATVKTPMPGLIKSVAVKVGQVVKKGERLIVLEAMKMENDIASPQNGIVKSIAVSEGTAVEKNHVLCVIDSGAA